MAINVISWKEPEELVIPDIPDNLMYSKDLLYYIFDNPMYIMGMSEDFFLNYIVNHGYHANALCEALGVTELIIEIGGTEYKMTYSKPIIYDSVYEEVFGK